MLRTDLCHRSTAARLARALEDRPEQEGAQVRLTLTARVAAARTLLEENDRAPAAGNMPQIPGFAILIADARAQAMPIDVTSMNGVSVAHVPRLEADLGMRAGDAASRFFCFSLLDRGPFGWLRQPPASPIEHVGF